ncbi:hypothetical protein [Azotobacter armeniacus]
MNRHLRLCLYLLLCLALPINGMAGVKVQVQPCPMQTQMQMQHDDGTMVAGPDCGCHDDHPSAPPGGHLCKDGHQCKSGSPFQVATAKPPLLPPGRQIPSHSAHALPVFAPEPIWHPPRA